ncbi:MAG: hypothetical protein VX473_06600 [Candidatus Thermoplasmatota archaeon]|nr:hypothetical protein [Candidatus Thermoplasmatota archaeon]
MGAEAEPTQIRLVCVGNEEIATGSHIRKWMETRPLEDLDIDVQFDVELTPALEILENGEADLLAISASNWYLCKGAPNTMVAAALPRRDENHILIADDRIGYLQYKSIILANNRLQRRQLRRYRPDFRVLDPEAFADMIDRKKPTDSGLALQEWMEDLRSTKIISGYVSERHLFDSANIDCRRHMLMTDSREDSARFLPSPLNGLTLLISRDGFPKSLSEKIGDTESLTAWNCEQIILDSIDPDIHDRIGLIVRHRQIPSLLNQAEQEKDLLRSKSLLDTEGDPIGTIPMVEILIEVVGRTGERTFLLERLVQKEDAATHSRLLISEWEDMLNAITTEHTEDIRLGPARPAFLDL